MAEGDAPIRALQAALQQQPEGQEGQEGQQGQGTTSGETREVLQAALRGVVWTRSMRRMYTLVERWDRGQRRRRTVDFCLVETAQIMVGEAGVSLVHSLREQLRLCTRSPA